MKVVKFNPDELQLSKSDIFDMLDGINQRFKKNKASNLKFIISLEAMKVGIRMMDEETLAKIWTEIINGFNQLLYENALADGKVSWAQNLKKVKEKLKDNAGDPIE